MNLPHDERDFCDDSDDFDSDKLDLSLVARYEPLRDAYFNPFYDEIPPNDGLGPNSVAVTDWKRQPKQRQKLANHLYTSKSIALSRSQSQSHLKPQSHRSNPNVTSGWNHHDDGGRVRGRGRGGRRTESMRHIDVKTTSRSNSAQTLLAHNTKRDAVDTNAHHHANHEDSNTHTDPSTPLPSSLTGIPTALPSSLPSPTTTATTIGDYQECKGLLDLGSAISSALGTDDDDDDHHDHYGRTTSTTTDTLKKVCEAVKNMNLHPTDDTAIRAPPTTTTTRTRKEWFDLVDMNQVTPDMRRRLLRRNGRTRNTYCLQSIFATKSSSSSSPRDRYCHGEDIMPSWWDLPDVTPYESSMQSQASTTTTTTTAVTKPAFPSCYIVKQQRQEPNDDQQQQEQQDQQPPVPKANDTRVYRIRVSARQLDRPQQQQRQQEQHQQEQQQQQQTPLVPKPGETLVYRIRVTARKLNPDEVVAWADSPTFQKPKLSMDKGLAKRQPSPESKTTRSKSEEMLPPLSPPALDRQPGPSMTMRDDQHYSHHDNSSSKGPTQQEARETTPRRRGATKRNTHVPPSA